MISLEISMRTNSAWKSIFFSLKSWLLLKFLRLFLQQPKYCLYSLSHLVTSFIDKYQNLSCDTWWFNYKNNLICEAYVPRTTSRNVIYNCFPKLSGNYMCGAYSLLNCPMKILSILIQNFTCVRIISMYS